MTLTLSLLGLYLHFFWNRFFSVTEGWFHYYSLLMLHGQIPYRDFSIFIQPLYLLQLNTVNAVFGSGFITARLMGVAERLLLAALLYAWLARLFGARTAFVAATTSAFLFGTFNADTIYSYWQTHLVFALAAGLALSLALDTTARHHRSALLVLAGFMAGLSFLSKQTGIIFCVYLGLFVLLTALVGSRHGAATRYRSVFCFGGGFAVAVSLVFVWLAAHGAVGPYLADVFGAASSKGSWGSILFGSFKRIFLGKDLVWLLRIGFICWLPLAVSNVPLTASGSAFGRAWRAVLVPVIALAMAAAVLIPYWSASTSEWAKVLYNHVRFASLHLIFYFCIILAIVYYVRLLIRGASQKLIQMALLAGFSLVVMYECSWSFQIDEASVVPGLGFALGVVLTRTGGSHFAKALRVAVYSACVVVVGLCSATKYVQPYEWWGWVEPDVRTAHVTSSLPLLRGLVLSEKTESTIAGITDVIVSNSGPQDPIFVFPHIPLFYLLADRKPPTASAVHYFDVCSDERAIEDAERILATPPAVIVNLIFPDRAWQFHEATFRGGKPSGQRKIVEAMEQLVRTYHYRLAREYRNRPGYPIQVWVRPQAER